MEDQSLAISERLVRLVRKKIKNGSRQRGKKERQENSRGGKRVHRPQRGNCKTKPDKGLNESLEKKKPCSSRGPGGML